DRLAAVLDDHELLLVLDNCEHVVEEVADLVTDLLGRVPGLRVLATGREPLGVEGEVVHAVEPLAVPPVGADPGRVGEAGAVRLFAERAAASSPGFALTADNAADVALLCRRLDGIPLALELAATRVRTLGVTGVLCRLDDRFRLLSTARRHLPPRQRTLRAMIDWSWDLLEHDERVLLRRLAVFSGGCSPADVEAVCSGNGIDPSDVLDLLSRLVDRSLVVAEDAPPAGRRLRLLETIADYACERLSGAGEAEEVRRRHAVHFTGVAERCAATLFGPGQAEGLRALDAEAGNLGAALEEAAARGEAELALRLAVAPAWYRYLRGRYRDGLRAITLALSAGRGGAAAGVAMAESTAVVFAILADTGENHVRRAGEVLEAFDGAPDGDAALERARAAWMIGFVLYSRGDQEASEELVARALPVFRERGDRWGVAAALAARASHALGR
ncbi:transcriptional regulator, partial [Nocardiopsis tropica]|nr:transcriptional regulator [Nocardiopsis tropica]